MRFDPRPRKCIAGDGNTTVGLFVTRSIVWEHGGDITLGTRKGGVLTVRVELPTGMHARSGTVSAEPDVAEAIGLGCSLRRKPEVHVPVGAVAQIGLFWWHDRSLFAYRLPNIATGQSIAYLPNACAICPTSLAQGMSIAA
jgi:hypothetical protein